VLDDQAIARYARQIVVPGIGAAGQQKLLASTVLVLGNERGCRQAALYLRAAGVRVLEETTDDDKPDVDLVIVADAATIDETTKAIVANLGRPVCWYSADLDGFTSGVHPDAPLPLSTEAIDANRQPEINGAIHDVAACDAASIACAILLGLAWRSGPFHFDC
jgi:hypothetical protein